MNYRFIHIEDPFWDSLIRNGSRMAKKIIEESEVTNEQSEDEKIKEMREDMKYDEYRDGDSR